MTIRVPHPILYNFFISSSIYFFEVLQYIYLYLRLVHEFVLGDGDGARGEHRPTLLYIRQLLMLQLKVII